MFKQKIGQVGSTMSGPAVPGSSSVEQQNSNGPSVCNSNNNVSAPDGSKIQHVSGPSSKQNGNDRKAPSIVAPDAGSGKGGGALRSISPTFQVNPQNGTLSLSLPISTTPGRAEFGPSIELSYDSGSGNGPFGIGWGFSVGSVTRKNSKRVPLYDDTDVFTISGAEDLVPVLGLDGLPESVKGSDVDGFVVQRYHVRVSERPFRIERWTSVKDTTDAHWRSITSENITTLYGKDKNSQIFVVDSLGNKRIFSWLACESFDSYGNGMSFTYKEENLHQIAKSDAAERVCEPTRRDTSQTCNRYLKSIKYGNQKTNRDMESWKWTGPATKYMFEVVFDYGEHNMEIPTTKEEKEWALRQDPFSTYKSGFEIRSNRLCRRLLMFHHINEKLHRQDYLVSSTLLEYRESPIGSFLTSVIAQHHKASGQTGYLTKRYPPIEMEYSKVVPVKNLPLLSVDTNNIQSLKTDNETRVEWIDLDADGLPGIFTDHENVAWSYQRNENANGLNEDGSFGPPRVLPSHPSVGKGYMFEDLDRTGVLGVVSISENGQIEGYFERSGDGWSDFRAFNKIPNIPMNGGAVKRVDLTGNGLQDLIFAADNNGLVWYNSLAKDGFGASKSIGEATKVPNIFSPGVSQEFYFSDMSGDGLSDIVRIRNNCVSYWPSLGHGRFGQEIGMLNCPSFDFDDQFTHDRVRLGDFDGSGTTDILYLPATGGARVYYNQSGNSWSKGYHLQTFPSIDNLSSVFMLDLLGTGTSCICWSGPDLTNRTSTSLQYVDLSGGQKPHLLTKLSNGFGKVTNISYKASTTYSREDELAGRKWQTKLAFPVHCVAQVEHVDVIAETCREWKYAYHEGFFDGIEREFRGFGIVEQWDSLQICINSSSPSRPSAPVHTKTWYLVGSPDLGLGARYTSPQPQMCESRVPETTPSELYHCFRSLKGKQIRQETYGANQCERNKIPYHVVENSYETRLLQPGSPKFHGVYQLSTREIMTFYYERDSQDPRIEHEMVLEVNGFGDILKSANVNYGRKSVDLLSLDNPKRQEQVAAAQKETIITYTESEFTNSTYGTYDYRHPALAEANNYRVLGFDAAKHLDIEQLRLKDCSQLSSLPTCGFAQQNPAAGQCKVLIDATAIFYWSSSLDKRLDLRDLETYSVLDQRFELCFTEDLLRSVYGSAAKIAGSPMDFALVSNGYVDIFSNKRWWKPSDQYSYSDGTQTELLAARSSFYTPTVTVNALKHRTTVTLDDFHLLPKMVTDALQNTTSAEYNYINLQPSETVDINGNHQCFTYDVYGNLAGTARMGKLDELDELGKKVGDSLVGFDPDVSSQDISAFFDHPTCDAAAALLKDATTCVIYNMNGFSLSQSQSQPPVKSTPAAQAQIKRDNHGKEAVILIEISYLNGEREVIQKLELVEEKPEGDSVWRIHDWRIIDDDERVLREYYPSFANSSRFSFTSHSDLPSKTTVYDPMKRVLATINPDDTWTKTSIESWKDISCDAGSTVLRKYTMDEDILTVVPQLGIVPSDGSWYERRTEDTSEPNESQAARKSEVYKDKQVLNYLNANGQTIASAWKTGTKVLLQQYEYDQAGNKVKSWDRRHRLVEVQNFDCLKRSLLVSGMDSGNRWSFFNVLDKPIFKWNSRALRIRYTYDSLERERETFLCRDMESASPTEILTSEIMYGDLKDGAQAQNLKGEVFLINDQSGFRKNERFDFKRNCVQKSQKFATNYKSILNWKEISSISFNPQESHISAKYDALDREVETRNISEGSTTLRKYTLTGNLQSVAFQASKDAKWISYLAGSTYDAENRPLRAEYGNNTRTEYRYDLLSQNLTRRWTSRKSSNGVTTILEDLSYTYDCLRRRTHISNNAQQEEYFGNVQVTPGHDYTYDALGQLIQAVGREELSGEGVVRPHSANLVAQKGSFPQDGSRLCQYVEYYEYDDSGNIRKVRHVPVGLAGWTRDYHYENASLLEPETSPKVEGNRLSRTSLGSDGDESYGYDDDAGLMGCMTTMPGYSILEWDFMDRLRCSSKQRKKVGTPETTWYVYDNEGNRVRKVTERSADANILPTKMKDTLYLPSLEIYRFFNGDGTTVSKEIKTSELSSGSSCIALIENGLDRYQTSENLELDSGGLIVSYEEYSPFGSPTYASHRNDVEATSKYRYQAYQRDVETGLFYCKARYLAAWLGRWISCDPLGAVDGLNLFCYSGNDPVNKKDPDGTFSWFFGCCSGNAGPSDNGELQVNSGRPSQPLKPQMDNTELLQKKGDSGVRALADRTGNRKQQAPATNMRDFKFPEVKSPGRQEVNLMNYHDSYETADIERYANKPKEKSGPDWYAKGADSRARASEAQIGRGDKPTSVNNSNDIKFPEVRDPKRQEVNLMNYYDSYERADVERYANLPKEKSGPDWYAESEASRGRAYEAGWR